MIKKFISVLLILTIILQTTGVTIIYAVTDGPSIPEASGFSPVSNTDVVDLFTGDFKYNIPLMDVGGYPLNLAYSSNPTMEQEASWVGLGWSLSPGSINRNLRGLPDDFSGDVVKKAYNIKENWTVGIDGSASTELFGFGVDPNTSMGIFYNSYKGFGITRGFGVVRNCGGLGKGTLTAGLGVSLNSHEGLNINPTVSFNKIESATDDENDVTTITRTSLGFGGCFSSRGGLKEVNFGRERKVTTTENEVENTNNKNKSGSLSFNRSIYTPKIETPMLIQNYSLKVKVGLVTLGVTTNKELRGYYNKVKPLKSFIDSEAYGYFYEERKRDKEEVLLDIYRENDGTVDKTTKNLAVPVHSNDLFNVAAEGLSGQFRAYRGDVGILHDRKTASGTIGGSTGAEIAPAPLYIKAGLNISANLSRDVSRKWKDQNLLRRNLDFFTPGPNTYPNYEPAYFKFVTEGVKTDAEFNNQIHNEHLLLPKLNGTVLLSQARSAFQKYDVRLNNASESVINSQVMRGQRDIRATNISYLTIGEKDRMGYPYFVPSYGLNQFFDPAGNMIQQSSFMPEPLSNRPAHHIGQIDVTNTEGKRYSYGIPVYNNFQKDVSFAVGHLASPPASYLCNYSSGGSNPDNSTNNIKGLDNYYSAQEVPAYVTSYLLTSVVSADYVDRLYDGITNDDPGTWVKFNYSKVSGNYRWRIPFEQDQAKYNEGYLTDELDDKASYVYGEKEIWVNHSIESRNYIAIFIVEPYRWDGLGVKDENGGIGSSVVQGQSQVALKEIRLYTKANYLKYGMNAVPVKTAHFVYTNELCKGIPNSRFKLYQGQNPDPNLSGKLTLKEVYFTYGKNTRGQFNKYKFTYDNNPDYNPAAIDRWGNYKSNSSNYNKGLNNAHFPYTSTSKSEADLSAGTWSVNKIDLPTGGVLQINYEADDYAYVQNRRACEMSHVLKVGTTSDYSLASNKLYQDYNTPNNYWFVECSNDLTGVQDVRKAIFGDEKYIYYKSFVEIKENKYEYVEGYGEIVDCGKVPGSPKIFWVKVASEKTKLGNTSPVTRTALQMLRNDLHALAFPNTVNPNVDVVKQIKSILGSILEVKNFIIGFDGNAFLNEYAREYKNNCFWVRTYSSELKRFGGGSRVKSIITSDSWATSTSNDESSNTFVTRYDYTTTEVVNGLEKVISSGVSSYEPTIGGEENTFKQPLKFSNRNFPLSPIDNRYVEEPVGESYFPAAVVGYSKVRVINVDPADHSTPLNTGYSETDFFTSRDYPTIIKRTSVEPPWKFNPRLIMSFIKFCNIDLFTATQAYYVELNDMHGKIRAQNVYNARGVKVSGTKYNYADEINDIGVRHLANTSRIINQENMQYTDQVIGQDIDLVVDMRESNTKGVSGGAQINMDLTQAFVPISVLNILPDVFFDFVRLRTAVTVKIVNKTGLIKSVESYRDGAIVFSENLGYDSKSGEVIFKSSNDEFNRKVFELNQPAFWKYGNMGSSYYNTRMKFTVSGNGMVPLQVSSGDVYNLLSNGDQLIPASMNDEILLLNYYRAKIPITYPTMRFWVAFPADCSNQVINKVIMDDRGDRIYLNGTVSFRVIRSGHTNQLTDKMAGMKFVKIDESILSTPFGVDENGQNILTYTNCAMLDVNAVEYRDNWRLDRNKFERLDCDTVVPMSGWSCFKDFLIGLVNLANSSTNGILHNPNNPPLSVADILAANSSANCNQTSLAGLALDSIYLIIDQTAPRYVNSYLVKLGPNCYFGLHAVENGVLNLDTLPIVLSNVHDGVIDLLDSHNRKVGYAWMYCTACNRVCEEPDNLLNYNPFVEGLINRWYPEKNWIKNDIRKVDLVNSKKIAKNSGTYFNSPFPEPFIWAPINSVHNWQNVFTPSTWENVSTVTKRNKSGIELETKDALGNYHAGLYGYGSDVQIASSKNSKYRELYFTGYEDLIYKNDRYGPVCLSYRWDSEHQTVGSGFEQNTDLSHSGATSIFINTGGGIRYETKTQLDAPQDCYYDYKEFDGTFSYTGYVINPKMDFDKEKTYEACVWVHKEKPCDDQTFGSDIGQVQFIGGNTLLPGVTVNFKHESIIIDGWQLYKATFTLPAGCTSCIISFGGGEPLFIDDFRVAPKVADTKAFVYDNTKLKLVTGFDANHFGVFYEYDDEGNLIRIKKETERGIMTLKEYRKNMLIQP